MRAPDPEPPLPEAGALKTGPETARETGETTDVAEVLGTAEAAEAAEATGTTGTSGTGGTAGTEPEVRMSRRDRRAAARGGAPNARIPVKAGPTPPPPPVRHRDYASRKRG